MGFSNTNSILKSFVSPHIKGMSPRVANGDRVGQRWFKETKLTPLKCSLSNINITLLITNGLADQVSFFISLQTFASYRISWKLIIFCNLYRSFINGKITIIRTYNKSKRHKLWKLKWRKYNSYLNKIIEKIEVFNSPSSIELSQMPEMKTKILQMHQKPKWETKSSVTYV